MLGCAGMADLAAALPAEFGVPVVDGVAAAVTLAEGLGGAAARDRRSAAAMPRRFAKAYSGMFARVLARSRRRPRTHLQRRRI